MKKRVHILLLVVFVSTLGLAACSDQETDTVPLIEESVSGDLFDPRFDSGDEEDSIRDPHGS